MKTYSFTFVNRYGNGSVVEKKEFSSDELAKEYGRELLERGSSPSEYIEIDKWADGYPPEDSFGTEDAELPIESFVVRH